jgi:hypothetical protein
MEKILQPMTLRERFPSGALRRKIGSGDEALLYVNHALHLGNPRFAEAADVLARMRISPGSLKKSPKSPEVENVAEQQRYEKIGSSGRTRTYNPSVNSRMLCH